MKLHHSLAHLGTCIRQPRRLGCFTRTAVAVITATVLTSCVTQPSQQQPAPSESAAVKAAPVDSLDQLQTVAESSDYKATGHYADVVQFVDALTKLSPLAHRVDMGKTEEGRPIPVVVIADPPISSAEELAKSDRMVVLMIGDIHAGEVCGKEALQMLARDILKQKGDKGESSPLLKKLILCFAPIYNADGNERFAKDNRSGQVGPEDGMGIRENSKGLDLNRDFVKAESSECRGLEKFMRDWDPAIFVDTHTTDGSFHGYLMTYDGPKTLAGDPSIVSFVRDTMLPDITKSLKARTGIDSFFYGNFNAGHTQWETYPPEARYSTSYVGMLNRIGILSEAYAYSPFEDRVKGIYSFVDEILQYALKHTAQIKSLEHKADQAAEMQASLTDEADVIALTSSVQARQVPQKTDVLGFEEVVKDGRSIPTGQPRPFSCEIMDDFEPVITVRRPDAYLIPPGHPEVVENLQRHGIEVEDVREDIDVDVSQYVIAKYRESGRPFQGHHLVTVELVNIERKPVHIGPGWFMVSTDQRLGRLACYLLEPQSEDGLTKWNFFDHDLAAGKSFPVLRIEAESDQVIRASATRPLHEDRIFHKTVGAGGGMMPFGPRGMGNFSGNPASGLRWIDDDHYTANFDRKLRTVEAATGRSTRYESKPGEAAPPSAPAQRGSRGGRGDGFFGFGGGRGNGDREKMIQAIAKLPGFDEESAKRLVNRPAGVTEGEHPGEFFNYDSDLYYVRLDGSQAMRLTSDPDEEELAEFSPDGKFVSFVRNYDLYVVDTINADLRRLTTGGSEMLRHGKLDWVYEEELFNRNWTGYWWSPDSTRIAFLESDCSQEPVFTITDDQHHNQRVEHATYPKPGDPNPIVRLGVVTATGGGPDYPDMSNYNPQDLLISGVYWWPDSSAVYFYAQNRVQTWLDVLKYDGKSGGAPAKLLRDQTKCWIESPGELTFLKDGSFLMTSERTGWKNYYRYKPDGTQMCAVTAGEGEVSSIDRIDEAGGWLYFYGRFDDGYIGRNYYKARLDGGNGSPPILLTSGKGTHRVELSPSGKYLIDNWSTYEHPTRVDLRSGENGQLIRTIDSNPVYAMEEYALGEDQHITIKARDGYPLEATLVKPPDFDPHKKYPIWFTTYGGPHTPTVSDQWKGGNLRDQELAAEGILVFGMDPRPASGKGAVSAWTAYKQLGVQELMDIEDGIHWLTSHPWADATRVGMTGYSYGGFMTAYTMTHSDILSCGIAGGPPTDWREYDSIYTERYMLLPQDNPDGYDKTSVILAAENLHGRLRLVHGTIDDNVHLQNSLRLIKALEDHNRDFEMLFYPGFRHGVWGAHYQRMIHDFILDSFGLTERKEPTTSQ